MWIYMWIYVLHNIVGMSPKLYRVTLTKHRVVSHNHAPETNLLSQYIFNVDRPWQKWKFVHTSHLCNSLPVLTAYPFKFRSVHLSILVLLSWPKGHVDNKGEKCRFMFVYRTILGSIKISCQLPWDVLRHSCFLRQMSQISDHLNCPVCMCQLTNTATTPCGHRYCYNCIKECVGRHHKCPVCNHPLQVKQLILDKTFDELISEWNQ